MTAKPRTKAAKPKARTKRRAKATQIIEDSGQDGLDLRSALTELLAPKNARALALLGGALSNIRREFDPAHITMTSTTIPDAISKLTSALTESSKASHNVFDIIDRLTLLSSDLESLVNDFCQKASITPPDQAAISAFHQEHTRRQREVQAIAHEVVIAQSFQDLCGQNITKVLKLIRELDIELRSLFKQVKAPLPASNLANHANDEIDQAFADSVFE
ncbi:MAG: protein phosphatase CheZ [Pseudomonadota bacterium]|jgi:chemotaxis regulatin CheY-phosphate phosphatase CheZ